MVKWIVVAILAACARYVHFRGRERHRLLRQLTDHSTFMAPINVLMYAFSRVPGTPYLTVSDGLLPDGATQGGLRAAA